MDSDNGLVTVPVALRTNFFKVGLIRVVTLDDPVKIDLHGLLIMKYFPQLVVESKCIEDQYEGVHDAQTHAASLPKIIELAKHFNDIDALIVSCALDPAVKELRKILDVPVIGVGESVASVARKYGAVSGVLGITDYAPDAYTEVFGDNLINFGRPEGVNSTLDLLKESGKNSVIKRACELKNAGAMSISLACTGMSTIGISREIYYATGLPVIDPIMAAGASCLYECMNKAINRGG